MQNLDNPAAPPAVTRAQAMRAAARFSYTTTSGNVYVLQRATGLTMVAAGLPPEFFVQFVTEKPAGPDGQAAEAAEVKRAQEDPALLASLFGFMGSILAAHLVEPRLVDCHPSQCPDDAVTLGDLPENDGLELFHALAACVTQEGGQARIHAAATFRTGPGGPAVPGNVPPVQPEPGAAADGG